ncbi:MAG: WbqC family protein [Flavobacteriaceae bacterium]
MRLFYPTYFGSIYQYARFVQGEGGCFEVWDSFEKQTYRNRCYILGPNGKQMLNIPLRHEVKQGKPLTREMLLDDKNSWRINHIRSLDAAYSSSPFYEYYRDELLEIYEDESISLSDFQKRAHLFVMQALDESFDYEESSEYQISASEDFRSLVNAKKTIEYDFKAYTQVFDDKHGFTENLSILDLIFNLGPAATRYLYDL